MARLSQCFGKVLTIGRRDNRWVEDGVFDVIREGLAEDRDTEWMAAIGSHVVNAHSQTVGALAKKVGESGGLGRSRAGLTSKPHSAADGLGSHLRIILTPGHRGDGAAALTDGRRRTTSPPTEPASDANHLRLAMTLTRAGAVIDPHAAGSHRTLGLRLRPRHERNLGERGINRL